MIRRIAIVHKYGLPGQLCTNMGDLPPVCPLMHNAPSANRSDAATDRAPAVAETDTGGGAPLRLRPGQSAALAQASRARPAGASAAGCLFVPTVFPRSNPLIIM